MDRMSRLVVMFLATILNLGFGSSQQPHESDRESLRIFLQATLPEPPAFNLSDSPCRWPGVSCSDTDNRVTRIDWEGWGLRGSIPQESIGNLDSLFYLNLYNNSISGSLPPDLWDLPQLQHLNLSKNDLQGSISFQTRRPSGLFFLDLSQNRLGGQIPLSIGSLSSLVVLNLSRNDFQDLIPGAIFGCTFLRTLDLSFNRISGTFPSGLSHLVQLQGLYLHNNMLSGAVPPEMSRLHYLAELDLSDNQFSGPFPRVDGLRKLEVVNVSGNFLGGTIPTGVFRIPGLRSFSARKNFFVGRMPTPSLMQSKLSYIDLGENNLSGNVSLGLWSMSSVKSLRLDGNRLSGPLPSQIGAALEELDLRDNEFSGPVFPAMEKFRGLSYLELSSNRLNGPLPDSLTGFQSLVHLGMDNNPFMESRFPKIQGLDKLEYLNLSATQVTGRIPEEIGSLQSLKQLDLSHNELNGTLPESLGNLVHLTLLDLSYNQLNGSIPGSMAKLTELQHLNFSYNDLSGDVPSWPFMLPMGLLGNKGLCGRVVNVPCPREVVPSPGFPAGFNPLDKNEDISGHKRRLGVAVIIGIATGSAVALVCLVAGLFYCRSSVKIFHKKHEPAKEERFISMSGPFSSEMDPSVWAAGVRDPHTIPVVMFEKPLLNLTFSDLVQATANFSKDAQLPDGGCGPVFQGILPGGIHVAVKILGEGIPSEDLASACAQLATIGRLKHPNVVALLGYCMVGVERLLVYDYVQDGGDVYGRLHELPEGLPNTEDWSTDTWEHGQEGNSASMLAVLPWSVRHSIALCAARALAFLHHGCSPPVVHGDVKASNVLLDAELEARLAGTGLSQLVEIGSGEMGYVPPEFSNNGINSTNNAGTSAGNSSGSSRDISPKGDVFSFGVVLLELVTGKRPVGDEYPGGHGAQGVVQWTRWLVKEKRGYKALDARVIRGDEDMTEMLEALRVAYLCTAETPSKRPTMQQVVGLLKDLRPSSSMSGELVGGSF